MRGQEGAAGVAAVHRTDYFAGGAAVRDVVRILRRRFPNVHLTLYPVRVQGEGAATEIVQSAANF